MILIYGQYVLVPFIFALVLWFTVRIFTAITQKIPFYGKIVPNGVKKIISTAIIFLVLFVSSQVVLSSFNNIIKSHHDYDDNTDDGHDKNDDGHENANDIHGHISMLYR